MSDWRRGLAYAAGALVLLAVGGPAATASYRHAATVAERYGEAEMAGWLPLTTDGMLVAALIVMGLRRWDEERVGSGPWVAFILGMAATLGANFAAADIPRTGFGGVVVALWPPIAFALTLELLAMVLVRIPRTVDTQTEPDPAGPVHERTADEPAPDMDTDHDEPDQRTADRTGPPDRSADDAGPPDRTDLWTVEDEEYRVKIQADIDGGPVTDQLPSVRSVRSTYGLGIPRAKRIHARLRPADQRVPEPVQ